jgi:predicted RNase H-like HicB family nuclease
MVNQPHHITLYRYTVFIEPSEDGYVATVPALNGISTYGATLDETRTMAKEAILGYLEALAKAGQTPPHDYVQELSEPIREVMEVSVVA